MIKIGIRKAEIMYKVAYSEARPKLAFSFVSRSGERLTIFGFVRDGNADFVFRVCPAEEYFRKVDGRSASLAARRLLDDMHRMVMRSDYLGIQLMLEELTESHNRITRISEGSTVEPRSASALHVPQESLHEENKI